MTDTLSTSQNDPCAKLETIVQGGGLSASLEDIADAVMSALAYAQEARDQGDAAAAAEHARTGLALLGRIKEQVAALSERMHNEPQALVPANDFQREILQGIPAELPEPLPLTPGLNHAPKRPAELTRAEIKLAVGNALRYFPKELHRELAVEFAEELKEHGHIYMFRLRPGYEMKARPLSEYPARSQKAAAIMLMYQNNLDRAVAQHPEELVTYGGNGAVFQNWAQYRLTMQLLANLRDDETLVLYSGHPHSIFKTNPDAPRLVITNGLRVGAFTSADELDRLNALGVTQYGQMTAGSAMYIGPQGIVHGTFLTFKNAGRRISAENESLAGKLIVSSGLGGMSGAQAKAGKIAGAVTVVAEVNEKALERRHEQGWVDERYDDIDHLISRIRHAQQSKEAVSIAYHGNVVELWEALADAGVSVDIGSDQTSLHNAFGGGYYPAGMSFEDAQALMAADRDAFKDAVQESLRRHVTAIQRHTDSGTYFFDYGNSFLRQASEAGADITRPDGSFTYPSYVEDMMGPLCFDYGFGPFRWVCTSCDPKDLAETDRIAAEVLRERLEFAPPEIAEQLRDNLEWIESAQENKLVVGSQARILYSDSEGRIALARAFNAAIAEGRISGPIVFGRDHHDVSGTDSPYRETANIKDGSNTTADMATQNVIGDSFRGATWVSLHDGGGVGSGFAINGGFGLVLDGSDAAESRACEMLLWDVNNGIARRAWAGNPGAIWAAEQAMAASPDLRLTLPGIADESLVRQAVNAVFDS